MKKLKYLCFGVSAAMLGNKVSQAIKANNTVDIVYFIILLVLIGIVYFTDED